MNQAGLLVHLPHVLDDLQVQFARLGIGQCRVLQQRSWPGTTDMDPVNKSALPNFPNTSQIR